MAASGSLFQNYMVPLRLVLSPADMVAIFINLEVRAPAPATVCRLRLPAPLLACPQRPRELCPGQGLGRPGWRASSCLPGGRRAARSSLGGLWIEGTEGAVSVPVGVAEAHTPGKRCGVRPWRETCPLPLRAEPVARSADAWPWTQEGRPCGKPPLRGQQSRLQK